MYRIFDAVFETVQEKFFAKQQLKYSKCNES